MKPAAPVTRIRIPVMSAGRLSLMSRLQHHTSSLSRPNLVVSPAALAPPFTAAASANRRPIASSCGTPRGDGARRAYGWRAGDHDANGIEPRRRQGPAGLTAVLAGNLPDQGKAQSGAHGTGSAAGAIKGGKNSLAVVGRNARAVIGDQHCRLAIGAAYVHRNRRHAVLLGVVEEAAHHHRLAGNGAMLVARSLLGGNGEQIDVLAPVHSVHGIEPTGEQDLIDQ